MVALTVMVLLLPTVALAQELEPNIALTTVVFVAPIPAFPVIIGPSVTLCEVVQVQIVRPQIVAFEADPGAFSIQAPPSLC